MGEGHADEEHDSPVWPRAGLFSSTKSRRLGILFMFTKKYRMIRRRTKHILKTQPLKQPIAWASLVAIIVASWWWVWAQQSPEPRVSSTRLEGESYQVARIVDGDTIELEGGQLVRYIGMDTPEIGQAGRLSDCFADEASQRNADLVLGRSVRLVKDVRDVDRFGRWLRYVFADDQFINLELVRSGHARSFTVPPDVLHEPDFQSAESQAKTEAVGLWSACAEEELVSWNTNSTPESAENAEMLSILKDHQPATLDCECGRNAHNCSDFTDREQAQQTFECCLVKTRQDVHWLDGDQDGLACEGWQ